MKQITALIILDGFGCRENADGNAIRADGVSISGSFGMHTRIRRLKHPETRSAFLPARWAIPRLAT